MHDVCMLCADGLGKTVKKRFRIIFARFHPVPTLLHARNRFAEAFQSCEYGRQTRPQEINVLFPFFP
jgi:hypothetical protein